MPRASYIRSSLLLLRYNKKTKNTGFYFYLCFSSTKKHGIRKYTVFFYLFFYASTI